jgi:5'-nucleotidase
MAIVLVTNDDGIHAAGLAALAEALEPLGEVWVVAPEREQSACGHALTLHRPLRPHQWGERRFAVNGTPSDCVNLAVLGFLPERPALVASGINHGSNLGDDVTYSGTVSAAFEGALLGIPSVAVSQEIEPGFTFDAASGFAARLARKLLERALPPKTLVNINVPAGTVRGVRVGRLGTRRYGETVIEKTDPRGRPYYWIGSTVPVGELVEGTDISAVAEKFISMTPVHLDLTAYQSMELLQSIAGGLSPDESVPSGRVSRDRS